MKQIASVFDDTLKPVTDYLHSIEYVGDIDMNCMVDKKGTAWPLEFTCRPGWPAFRIMQACHKGDPVQWMLDLIKGENTLKVNTDVAIGVVMAQPDFPYSNATGKEVTGIPVFGMDDVPRNLVSPADMMMGKVASLKNGKVTQIEMPVTCGDYVIVCTGLGSTVSKAKEAAYKVVDKISFPNSPMYRTDIGARLEEQLPLLQKHGYATEFVF
ncbi:phosphoribosylglycinamide synthetase C domain-containing protein [Paraburkholderia nemoris]|uniref:phosphoribosylglycinamide synthetase C domain-containing protein n=1 Tax=Paraburkholderia nemoris TaxID=2793076 RepID=UPI0038BD43A9